MRLMSSLVARLTPERPRKMVRPWALSAPILVLLVALPLLRPLRYPLPRQISDEEQARLATGLTPHVPAATLVLAAAACLVHVTLSPKKTLRPFWMATAGLCAALAAAIDPTAIPFLFLLLVVVGAVRRRIGAQVGGILA